MFKRLIIALSIFAILAILATQTPLEDYFFEYKAVGNANPYGEIDDMQEIQVVDKQEVQRVTEQNKKDIHVNQSKPTKLEIPSLKESAQIKEVGLTHNGAMETVRGAKTVGWYKFGAIPGENGNALLAGHRDWYREMGTFFKLDKMKEGDELIISFDDESTQTFQLVSNTMYPLDAVPEEIMAVEGESRVTLITCGGIFNKNTGTYDSRVVAVFKKILD